MLEEDLSAVNNLAARCGLKGSWDKQYWKHLTVGAPEVRRLPVPRNPGWVLEALGQVVGSVRNLILRYAYSGEVLTAAVPIGFTVAPEYRGAGLKLLKAFVSQPTVDILLVTTANPRTVAPLLSTLFKFEFLPQEEYYKQLIWVLRPRAFAAEFESRQTGSKLRQWAIRAVLPPFLLADGIVRGRVPRLMHEGLRIDSIGPASIGPEFDALWHRVAAESKRLLQVRDAEVLRWRFDRPGARFAARVVRCERVGCLTGYAVVEFGESRTGLRKATISDLLAERDDPDVVSALFAGAYEAARDGKAAFLNVIGFPTSIRQTLMATKPYVRDISTDHKGNFLFKAPKGPLAEALRSSGTWYACGSDGDSNL
jgi:hypothetical protein